MAKRKQVAEKDDSGSESDNPTSIDLTFDFFDPNPNVDYHAIHRLLLQLFHTDAAIFNPHALVELILSQPLVGTTVKASDGGMEGDPMSLLTVLNMRVHKAHESIKAIGEYALKKSESDPVFNGLLKSILAKEEGEGDVGLIISERLINMPPQIAPPSYKMLANEIQWAIDDAEPYQFSHYLFLSRAYVLTAEEEETMRVASRGNKRQRLPIAGNSGSHSNSKKEGEGGGGTYPFHPEDDVIAAHALHTLDFAFTSTPSEPRDADSFGLDVRGRMMLVKAERMGELVIAMEEAYRVPGEGTSNSMEE
ncbi:hypothetical protein HWV62_28571 [Athelia sp. TMB]|nr:hypothetical protein HWV62_28571 [Athelia sp. TMB]